MSSDKKKEFIPVANQQYTTQITPNDVMGTLKAHCLVPQYKSLRQYNIKTMKNWIVSRPKKIETFQAFVMLCLHCKDVVKTLCLVEILNVCKELKTLTADCLDNIQILRSKPPGNRQGNWMKKKSSNNHY